MSRFELYCQPETAPRALAPVSGLNLVSALARTGAGEVRHPAVAGAVSRLRAAAGILRRNMARAGQFGLAGLILALAACSGASEPAVEADPAPDAMSPESLTGAPEAPEVSPESAETGPAPAETDTPEVTVVAAETEPAPEPSPMPVSEEQPAPASDTAFGFEQAVEAARALSREAFQEPATLPQAAANLNYDTYRRIQGTESAMAWGREGEDTRVLFDPRGYLFTHDVKINIAEDGEVRARPYSPEDFNFFDLPLPDEARDTLGFSGFRLLAPINRSGKFDEVVSFKGASFFRALGAGNVFGASARGLSIGTASPDGEEFPFFREFWLVRPEPGDTSVRVYALMDSASVTGAFAFDITPGPMTEIDVDAVFFPRRELRSVGVAPITSMYFFSPQDSRKQTGDYRPAVHDSEGLAIRMHNGEWVWRPLSNPQTLQVSVLAGQSPRGFGLMQRRRDFDDYSDMEAGYEHRPNVWIEPKGDWGAGQLTLVEIPTANEYNDNIVTFWRPREPWQVGEPERLSYSMTWSMTPPEVSSVVAVEETRAGRSPGSEGRRYMFAIDYGTGVPASFLDGAEPFVTASQGRVLNPHLVRHRETGRTRLTFEFDPQGANIAEFRALVTKAGRPVTETWLYRWRPE